MAGNAVIQAIPNNSDTYAVFNLSNVENVVIAGGTIKGEWGHCIKIIEGCNNIKIDSVITQDGWGDGIYLGSNMTINYLKNVLVTNVISTNNRRQGLSIVSCDGVIIRDSDFTNQNGTAPESGIGIEPNHWETHKGIAPKNIIIENCLLSGNMEKGFMLRLNGLKRKVFILVMVSLANLLDNSMGLNHMFRTMMIFGIFNIFYY
ncbi:right-handed parallel beta-helix repeat-containing protein [Pelosinus sp. UFO1]|uniref:right-handed parallel beta-helix repeat-containing protein n=1 Tax=Pelosinus sp. UFO1 TaxID=484770 RepID=UPI0004D11528|nr:right-handed parallel beta-helix repeat-containing protein [Pelosinus sp. UFO1]AIF51815.1 hypothetical protein UFO1_2268 [Pelosinus sp. UFO1]